MRNVCFIFYLFVYHQYKGKTGIANGRKSKVQHQTQQDALNSLLLTL
jgi:hypothetical protein